LLPPLLTSFIPAARTPLPAVIFILVTLSFGKCTPGKEKLAEPFFACAL
jgi:hypothetical protein